jgi:hypothetical protein
MGAAMDLLENERQPRVCRDCFCQFKDRIMSLADARKDSPCGSLVPIERVRNRPAILIEVGRGPAQADDASGRRGGLEHLHVKFVEVQIAVVGAPRSAFGKRIVSQQFQANGGDLS